ncbi:Serine/threonine-protein kinase TOR [Capsicum baccatum]|uniref:Serine/threonine-protein kinase TOR n=1 Tax=Capsicum baccatum TaxID=33114 RepID=A0A2G2V5B0_CAPBA|nr:Serine/threonine-protein kinase TOR [Capsicum baccatum]
MGSRSQAICYPVVTSGTGNIDALNRVLADLCTRSNPEDGAALTLRWLVEEEARDLSGEAFPRFMDHLYKIITIFLDSNEVSKNLGALRVIDELIDVTISENASKVAKFSNYMSATFETKRDPEILVLASKVIGHIDRYGGAMTADKVELQVKVALEWLLGERIEYCRFAAVLILKEMAENASTVFNVHVPEFVDSIWVALRDPTLVFQEKAIEALCACIRVIEKRETRNTGEFMMSRYREVAEIVLRYLEHRYRLVRLSITSLLPQIAYLLHDRFVTNYLMICRNHILHVLKIPAESASGFIALGELAGALDGELTNYLLTITSHLRDVRQPSLEALACAGNIAKAMGPTMEPHVCVLLDSMFSFGLSLTLVEALEQITESIPPLLPTIQNQLLKCILAILSRSHHSMPRQSASVSRGNITMVTPQVQKLSGSALVELALRTLARFNFEGHNLLVLARESVVVYLENDDGATRKDVALCCCKLLANSFSVISYTQFSLSRINCASGKRRRRLVEEV